MNHEETTTPASESLLLLPCTRNQKIARNCPKQISCGKIARQNQFLNFFSLRLRKNRKKVPQMPASGFPNHTGRLWPNPGSSFHLPVVVCRKITVPEEHRIRVKRDLIHSQKRPTIIGIPGGFNHVALFTVVKYRPIAAPVATAPISILGASRSRWSFCI